MNTMKVTKRKIRLKKQAVIGLSAMLVILCGVCIFTIFLNHRSLVEDAYAIANTANKLADETITSEIYQQDDCVYVLHYPVFKNKTMDEQIQTFLEKAKKQNDQAGMIYVDYESQKVFDQYVVLSLNSTAYETLEKKVPTHEMTKLQEHFVYDLKADKRLEPQDCLRYRALLSWKEKANLQVIGMDDTGIILGYEENGKMQKANVNFQDANLFKMDNENIPSILQNDKIEAKTHQIDERPMLAFTFDDGPNTDTTQRIADAFMQFDGRATFFELGHRMEWFPQITQYLVSEGHQVASHSYDHPNFTTMNKQEYMDQVIKTEDIFYALTGHEIQVFRAPGGFSNPEIEASVGMPFIWWDIDSLDWSSRNKDAIINEIVPYVHENAIILCHDLYETTADAIEQILPELDAMGYQFVTIDELMARKGE